MSREIPARVRDCTVKFVSFSASFRAAPLASKIHVNLSEIDIASNMERARVAAAERFHQSVHTSS